MKIYIRKHWLVLVGILIVGAYSLAPHFLFVQSLGESYNGVYLANTSDEHYYHARVQEIFEGYSNVGNAYIFEHKQDPWLQPVLGETFIFGIGKITGLSGVNLAIFAYKFLLPLLLFVTLYALFYLLSKGNSWLATIFGLSVIIGTSLFVNPKELFSLLGIGQFTNNVQLYLRPINPQVSSLNFFLYLIFLYLALSKKELFYTIVAILLFGVSFYIYPYTWTFIIVLNGILFLYYIWTKEYKSAKNISLITGGGIILSLFYWWHVWQTSHLPAFDFAANTRGFRPTRQPVFSLVVALSTICVVFLAVINRRLNDRKLIQLLAALALTGWIVINQQVITGREIFHGHYHVFYNIPTLMLIGFSFLYILKKKSLFSYKFISGIIAIVIITNGFLTVRNIQKDIFPVFESLQHYGETLDWIKTETEKDDVIASTDLELNSMIPSYTQGNILTAFPATWYLVTPEELRHRYYIYLRFAGVEPNLDAYKNRLKEFPIEPLTLSGARLTEEDHNCPECITDEMIYSIVSGYEDFYQKDFAKELQKYRFDYLIMPKAHPQYSQYSFLEKIHEDQHFDYYQFNF